MLAGRMKLKYFLALVSAFGLAGVFLLAKACKSSEPPPKPTEVVKTVPPRVTPPGPQTPDQPTLASQELAPRAYDAEVIAWSKKSISGDKLKDVTKRTSYKINVYKEPGHSTVNRAKVDINRNDKWDEKYTFEAGKITLEVAPADDEQYTKTYHWTGSAWLPEGADATPAAAQTDQPARPNPDATKIDLPARAYDRDVIAWKDKSLPGDKGKDVSKGKSYKINVYMDAGKTTVNRAKVDINRNDKFDEKYTFEVGRITLQRAPADDEQYTETYHWTGGGWTKQ